MGRSRDDLKPGVRDVYHTVLSYRLGEARVEVIRVIDGRRDLSEIFSEH